MEVLKWLGIGDVLNWNGNYSTAVFGDGNELSDYGVGIKV
jgi:hypothetical protein